MDHTSRNDQSLKISNKSTVYVVRETKLSEFSKTGWLCYNYLDIHNHFEEVFNFLKLENG
jgi:hypothetical protein